MNTPRSTRPGRLRPGAALGLLALALGGCATGEKPLYYWGDYQPQLYTYFKGNDASPQDQLAKLEITAEEARAKGMLLPPGFSAHMGLLYLKTGQFAKAQAAFVAEETVYPESKPYMDFLLKRKTAVAAPARAGTATTVTTTTRVTTAPKPGLAPVAKPAPAAKPAGAVPPLPATKPGGTAPVLVPAPAPAPAKSGKPV